MRRCVLGLVLLAACGDDGGMNDDGANPDAAIDAPDLSQPLAIEFTLLQAAQAPAPVSELVVGPDGRVYGLADNQVKVSTDGGVTFAPTGTSTVLSNLVATSTALFGRDAMLVEPVLKRSTDNGATFATVTVPGVETNDRMFLAAHGDDLWVQASPTAGPTVVQHSTTNGTSFTALPLPVASAAPWFMTAGPSTLVIGNVNGTFRTTAAGTGWEDLGTPGQFPEHHLLTVTDAGTLLAVSSGGFHRRAVGATEWSTEITTGAIGAIVERANGQLVRVQKYAGTIETSDDDGLTWVPVSGVGWQSCQLYTLDAVPSGLVGTCYDLSTLYGMKLPTGASNWIIDEPQGLPPPQIANYADISFAADGTIALVGKQRVYLSHDNGATWTTAPYRPDSTTSLQAIAVSPPGDKIFVGGTFGHYAFLDGTGTPFREASFAENEESIIQAVYSFDTEVFVTTSESQFTAGSVWQGNPDRVGTWLPVNPFRSESNPQFDPTAGFLGVAACGQVIMLGVRRWFGTNSWDNKLKVIYQFGELNALWSDIETPAVGALPVAAMSCAENGSWAYTFRLEQDSLLYLGNRFGSFRQVASSTLAPGIITAKFSPDNHLWVVTGQGVFRSNDVVDTH